MLIAYWTKKNRKKKSGNIYTRNTKKECIGLVHFSHKYFPGHMTQNKQQIKVLCDVVMYTSLVFIILACK